MKTTITINLDINGATVTRNDGTDKSDWSISGNTINLSSFREFTHVVIQPNKPIGITFTEPATADNCFVVGVEGCDLFVCGKSISIYSLEATTVTILLSLDN